MGCYVKNDKIRIRKINDPDKYIFFEQGMRGGVSYILIKDIAKHLKMSISFIWT